MYRCMNPHEPFTVFLRSHSNLIWSMCRDASHGNWEQCRDLFQDVSLRLWQHFDELRPDAQPHERKAWVEWQTRHVLEHAGRRQRPEPLSELPEQADGDALVDVEIRTLINDLLVQLQPDERQLVQMRLEGYSANEIAKEMGLSRDAVYQRMHRALAKARKVLLVLFLLLVASSIAVAVVPSWRQRVFGGSEPETTDTIPVSVPAPVSPTPLSDADTTKEAVVTHHTWVPPDPIPRLVAIADTSLPIPLPSYDEPCGCPKGYRKKPQSDSIDDLSDPCEPLPDDLPEVTIMVVGNNIVVEGVDNETVDVFDARGRLVATARCNDHCMLTLGMQDHSYSPTTTSGTNAYWVQVGDRPRQQVFIKQLPRGNPTHPIPASTQRILMF